MSTKARFIAQKPIEIPCVAGELNTSRKISITSTNMRNISKIISKSNRKKVDLAGVITQAIVGVYHPISPLPLEASLGITTVLPSSAATYVARATVTPATVLAIV